MPQPTTSTAESYVPDADTDMAGTINPDNTMLSTQSSEYNLHLMIENPSVTDSGGQLCASVGKLHQLLFT